MTFYVSGRHRILHRRATRLPGFTVSARPKGTYDMSAQELGFDPARLSLIGDVGRRYVDAGQLPCASVQVARRGEVVYSDVYGLAHVEADTAATSDTVFRIYSMTKPITSIALMSLYEEGEFLLEDPVEKFLPEFADMTVWSGGSDQAPIVRPAANKMSIRDILTHTSGLTYGFFRQHPLDAIYRDVHNLGDFSETDYDLSEAMRRLGSLPLLFEPGTSWNYSMSTDVCGAVIEAITGQTLDVALAQRVTDPLGMTHTGFSARPEDASHLAASYIRNPQSGDLLRIDDPASSSYLAPPSFLSGGGGMVSTIDDYQKFCNMLVSGGTWNGERIIGRRTLEYMALNHLPGGALLNDLGQSLFAEVSMDGMGFGLGFSVIMDSAANGAVNSAGEFAWGGAASTAFWIDPVEEITAVFMTQLIPSSTYPLRRQLRAAVYQALL